MLDSIRSRVRSSSSGAPFILKVEVVLGQLCAFIATSCKAEVLRRRGWSLLGFLRILTPGHATLYKGAFLYESSRGGRGLWGRVKPPP